MTIAAALAHVARRSSVDPLDGTVTVDETSWGLSPADEAALEVALRLGAARDEPVAVATVGPPAAEATMRLAIAAGAARGVRIDMADAEPAAKAAALAPAIGDATLVVCGAAGLTVGSGATPAFLAAELGWAQALGCVDIDLGPPLVVERRTDRGGRDRLRAEPGSVISVEGSVARLRRAGLTAVLAAAEAPITVLPGPATVAPIAIGEGRPFRPRSRAVAGPDGSAPPLHRILDITDAMSDRDPPRILELTDDPDAAADAILAHLTRWGYLA